MLWFPVASGLDPLSSASITKLCVPRDKTPSACLEMGRERIFYLPIMTYPDQQISQLRYFFGEVRASAGLSSRGICFRLIVELSKEGIDEASCAMDEPYWYSPASQIPIKAAEHIAMEFVFLHHDADLLNQRDWWNVLGSPCRSVVVSNFAESSLPDFVKKTVTPVGGLRYGAKVWMLGKSDY